LVLIKAGGIYYTYDAGWVSLELSSPTEQDFLDYGVEDMSTIPIAAFGDISRPFEILKYIDDDGEPLTSVGLYDTEIYWAVKINTTLYSYINGVWTTITESEVFMKGMSKTELEAITDFSGIYEEGSITVVGAAKSNDPSVTWWLEKVDVELPDTFETGSSTILCPQLNISDWGAINSVLITETSTDNIRYAFSFDNKSTWKVYKQIIGYIVGEELSTEDNLTYKFTNVNLVGGSVAVHGTTDTYTIDIATGSITFEVSQSGKTITADYSYESGTFEWQTITSIDTEGMTKAEAESILNVPVNDLTLDIQIWLSNSDVESSPSVSQISIDYTTVDSPIVSDTIIIPVPEAGFRNVLVEGVYTLKLAEGIAFDDAEVDYDFYTTPNKIKLRPLDMGEVTGGRYSGVFAVEVINGYENDDFNVILSASKGGQEAEIKDSYGLFYDSERESSRTRIELSLVGEGGFNPTYPLQFRLNRDSSKIFYIRMKPTLTTAGYDTFQIKLIGRAV